MTFLYCLDTLDRTPHCFVRGLLTKHVDNLAAHVSDAHSLLNVEMPSTDRLHRVQTARVHCDMNGRHDKLFAARGCKIYSKGKHLR